MRRILFAIAALVLVGVFPAAAGAATFSNPAAIAINDSATQNCPPDPVDQGLATPYPSQIPVSGLGTMSDVNVTLTGFSHTSTGDVRVVLAGPGAQTTQLMSDVGSSDDASSATITFDDAAADVLPDPVVSGTFKPSQEDTACLPPFNTLSLPSPAPAAPYGTSLAGFNGTDPNGTWSLYVVDAYEDDTGSISGGWSLDISAPAVQSRRKCKKHKKKHHRAAEAKKKCKKHKKKHRG